MKKILFITQSYPSARSANVLCDDMVMQKLMATKEVEIHCLCMRYKDQLLEELVNGVHVHRIAIGRYFEYKDGALRRPNSPADRFVRVFDRMILRINQLLTIPVYPCYYPFRTYKFVRKARQLQDLYSFDAVACEHYGFETMMAGFFLKKKHPGICYFQFFWDALSGGTKPGYLPSFFVDKRRESLEERVLDVADCSVAMTSHREHLLSKDYARKVELSGKLRFLGIPYLQPIARNDAKGCPLDFDKSKVNVVFAGNLWGRNVKYIASVFAAVPDVDVVLWIVTSSNVSDLKGALSEYRDRIRFVSYMSHDELLRVLSAADALLNMGVKNPNAISGKIYEYMGCCKPIISTYSIDDEACLPVLRRYPLSLLVDERSADISSAAKEVQNFLTDSLNKDVDYSVIEKEFYNCTPEAYCELFSLIDDMGDVCE